MTSTEAIRVRSTDSGMLQKGEYGYPLGHLGHLTAHQENALVEFKELCAKQGLYKPGQNGAPGSHDDVTMLRFLRARRFVPKDAVQQFKDTEAWRETNEIDNLYINIDVKHFDETRKLYPQWTGRRDKRGLPVYVFEVAPLNSKRMEAYSKSSTSTNVLHSKKDHTKNNGDIPPRLYRLFALYENMIKCILPFCTALRDRPSPETPISQSNNIVDISGVGLKQFWNLRSHMQEASVLATAHYPETLDRIFIVGAPSFFPTVWGWIKRWFDPITTSKIFILSDHNAYKTLSTFIEPENIPKKYGGKLPFVFGESPILEARVSDAITWTNPGASWPIGPLIWKSKDDGSFDLWAVGSVDGKERRDMIATFRPYAVVEAESVSSASTKVAATTESTDALATATEKMNISSNGSVDKPAGRAATMEQPSSNEGVNSRAILSNGVDEDKKVEETKTTTTTQDGNNTVQSITEKLQDSKNDAPITAPVTTEIADPLVTEKIGDHNVPQAAVATSLPE